MVHSPLIWPFDAGFTVVCVSVVDVEDFGLVLSGGCSDEKNYFLGLERSFWQGNHF